MPSHWWHQVESINNNRSGGGSGGAAGYSIGVNMFYEPFYHRQAYLSRNPFFQHNRYYSHLQQTLTQTGSRTRVSSSKSKRSKVHRRPRLSPESYRRYILEGSRPQGVELCDGVYVCFRSQASSTNDGAEKRAIGKDKKNKKKKKRKRK